MLDNRLAQIKGEAFEKRIKGIYKKYGLGVIKLDSYKLSRRPDFLVNKGADKFVCECKFIASAGTLDSGKYHISTLDSNLGRRNKGAFISDGVRKTCEILTTARDQFRSLCNDDPSYLDLPFVVAIECDFFIAGLRFTPNDIFGLSEISAVIELESDIEIKRVLNEIPLEELEEIVNGTRTIKLPQNTLRFKVLTNFKCKIKFKPSSFFKNPFII